MSLISKLTPTNLEEEKHRFFEKETVYNPIFKYRQPIDKAILVRYGLPQAHLVKLAQRIVQKAYQHKNHLALVENEGKLLDTSQVYRLTKKFLQMHQLDKRYQIVNDATINSIASVTSNLIKFHPDTKFREKTILSTLYHEIGTHALRRINYEKQPWYKKKKQYGLTHNYLETEEGLAVIHGHLPRNNQLVYRSALKYLAVARAQKADFQSLFKWALPYFGDTNLAWTFVVRIKRGLTDTSHPSGFTKDMLYFSGFVKVWHWLKEHDFDPTDLYIGKVAIEDLVTAKKLNPRYQPILPSFYRVDPNSYKKAVATIGKINFLH